MKKKKFRHIHRYAYVVTDIKNTPWILEPVYDMLNSHGKSIVKAQGYVVPVSKTKNISITAGRVPLPVSRCPAAILKAIRSRPQPPQITSKKILIKNPDRGITQIDQVPESVIKRIPFWKK